MLPPSARSIVEEAILGEMREGSSPDLWEMSSPAREREDFLTLASISVESEAATAPENGGRDSRSFQEPSREPQRVMARQVSRLASPEDPGRRGEPSLPEGRSEEQYLDLLFGSIARTSPTPPELALAPVSRPTAAETTPEAQASAPARGEVSQEGQGREQDIEGLAQKVYSALRLRLMVERERLGI